MTALATVPSEPMRLSRSASARKRGSTLRAVDRRDFLQHTTAAGLVAAVPGLWTEAEETWDFDGHHGWNFRIARELKRRWDNGETIIFRGVNCDLWTRWQRDTFPTDFWTEADAIAGTSPIDLAEVKKHIH